MYEVKITVRDGNASRQITIGTFDGPSRLARDPRNAAIKFAKLIDSGFEVDVVNAELETVGPIFGLVYHRDAEF